MNAVIEKVLKIIQNLSSQTIYYKLMGKYCAAFFFLEMALKTEIISKSNRISAFKLMLKSQIEGENVEALKIFFNYLPEEIEKVKKNLSPRNFILEKNNKYYFKTLKSLRVF